MNLLQNLVDATLGSDAFVVADLDPNVLFMGVIFLMVFAYLALRSAFRFFLNLGNKF